MNQFKRAQVVMLPTENILQNGLQPYSIYSKPITKGGWMLPKSGAEARRLYQNNNQAYHLAIISDDEIEEDDWRYDLKCNEIFKTSKSDIENYDTNNCKKIIATTDTSLQILGEFCTNPGNVGYHPKSLPQPSQQFIEKYIECYNKGEVITDILVEYELDEINSIICYGDCGICDNSCKIIHKLKVNPKDNTITIKKLRDIWNREEVINLIKSFASNYQYASNDIGYNKWIEENL